MRLAVIWIDWYAYHVARFRALAEHPFFRTLGIELVGRAGVHEGQVFRHGERDALNVVTLLPQANWSSTSQFELARLLWKELDAFDPEAVLVPGYYTLPGISAALWAKKNGRRSILMTESTREDHFRVGWKEAFKKRILSTLFYGAIAGGKRHRTYLEELGVSAAHIGQCYDVVDNDYYRTECDALREVSDAAAAGLPANYFLYVGRIAPEKNLEQLIRAFGTYRALGGDWSLVLAGTGPDLDARRRQAADSDFSTYIQFAGMKSTAELIAYYSFASAFVLPSSREPWGLVVNEAMAAGLPVIVSRVCGCADDLVEHGGNGFLFDPREEGELADMLCRMSRQGPERRKQMSAQSLRRIAGYSPRKWADEVARICSSEHSPAWRTA